MSNVEQAAKDTYSAYQLADAYRDAMRVRRLAAPTGRLLPGAEAAAAAYDIAQNGASVQNVGDVAANGYQSAAGLAARGLAKRTALNNPVAMAGAIGWQAGRAIDENWERYAPTSHREMSDVVGGTINQAVRSAGNLVGKDWGVDDSAYLEQKYAEQYAPLVPVAPRRAPSQQGGMARRAQAGS